MPFTYERTIHFPDTDAAGVVFFARYLAICHEAYEEALRAAGVKLGEFASPASAVAIPVRRAECDYLRPLVCGDRVRVIVRPEAGAPGSGTFAVAYEWEKLAPGFLASGGKIVARARTEHVCIDTQTRERAPLPAGVAKWVEKA